MKYNDNDLNNSMFNFDFIRADESSQKQETPEPIHSDTSKAVNGVGSVKEFQKLTTDSDSNKGNVACSIDELVKFDVEMEKDATSYFTLTTMQEFNIAPAHFNSANATLTVLCKGHPDEVLSLRLEAMSIYHKPVRIVLQSETLDIITSLIERIKNSSIEEDSSTEPWDDNVNTSATGIENCELNDSFACEIFLDAESKFNVDASSDDVFQQHDSPGETFEEMAHTDETQASANSVTRRALFVTPEASLSPHLLFAIHAEKISPVIASDCEEALEKISSQDISEALIHNSLRGASQELALALGKRPNPIPVRYFNSEAGLLAGEVYDHQLLELCEKSLLFGAYLHNTQDAASSLEDALDTHGAAVAKLCREFSEHYSLAPNLHLALLSAAYWHDLARCDLKNPEDYQHSDIISLSAKRMEALGYPAEVISLLRVMASPNQAPESTNSDTLLAGNILAVSNHYCHNWLSDAPFISSQISEMRNDMQDFKNNLSLPEVADKLFDIIPIDSEAELNQTDVFNVHILDITSDSESNYSVKICDALQSAGFDSTVSHTANECVESWIDSKPQALMILQSGSVQQMTDTLFTLALGGIQFDRVLTIALTTADKLDQAFWSIKHGLEDVFPLSISPDVLIAKISRAQKRQQDVDDACLSILQDMGTHGSLEDMNLIKLLEASRDSSKPLRLSATARGRQFVAYVHNNTVISATCDEYTGIDAIAASIAWSKGIWSIDPIDENELPPSNLGMKLDSVMLEACLQCDNSARNSSAGPARNS